MLTEKIQAAVKEEKAVDKREHFIRLIKTLPEERVISVLDLVADELIQSQTSGEKLSISTNVTLDRSGYIVFEHKYENDVVLSSDMTLKLSYKNHPLNIKISSDTIMPQKYILAGETVYILGKIDTDYVAKAVVSKEFFDMFTAFDTTENKLNAMKKFLKLSASVQASFKAQLSGERFATAKAPSGPPTDMDTLRFKFDMCRNTYTPQQQRDIEAIFEECRSLTSTNKTRASRRLLYILNINQGASQDITMTKEEIIAKLDMHLHKHNKLKEKLAEAIVASKYSKKKGFAILLVGSPGVGKTAIMKAVAEVLEIPFFVIPLGSSTSIVDILGDAPHYDASDCGEVVKNYYKVGTTRVVVGLDEYDKSYESIKEGGKVSKAFNDALSDEYYFKDAFLGTYINTENTIFIATANSTDTIPANLLNRFTVIHVDDYNEDDKVEIAQKFILPSVLQDFGVSTEDIIVKDEAIKHVTQNFCEDDGVRDLKKGIESIVRKILSIWDSNKKKEKFIVDKAFVDTTLESTVNKNSPAIIYRRNKLLYSYEISEEIKDLTAKLNQEDLDGELREKYEKKLNYLVNLIPVGNAFSHFDKDKFYAEVNATHYGMESVKKEVAQIFNVCALNRKPLSATRLLFVGPPGVGKTSIVKSLAKACNSKYCKVSLNGISDDASIKGHSLSYIGADAGMPIRAIYKMKTTKGIVHLDEIDKMGSREGVSAAHALVDMLDDSSEFTDNYIGQPVDLSGIMFIATANDISAIEPVLLDRFTVIHLEGYTEKEKTEIVDNYIIPKAFSELVPINYKATFSEEAQKLITEVYCRSFGVRDAEKAIKRLIRDKLYSSRKKTFTIDADDVKSVLGTPPAERGNFPCKSYPGLSKALAVTGNNCGMAFSIETMLIPDDNSLTITGLPKESTIDSVKLAICYVKCHYPGMLKNKGIHVHFGEGAVQKDGPSAGVAILISLLSAAFNTSITENVSYTGEINGNGYIFNIGGTISKIQAAEQSGCTKVFIPEGNYNELSKDDLDLFSVEIVPVNHVSQVIESIFSELNKKIA